MTQKAYLAMGCFWGPDEYFSKLKGVVGTRVGYSGGKYKTPTYHVLGGNSETIEIEFDPSLVSFSQILEHFFLEHEPCVPQDDRYRSAIFYLNDDQKKEAEKAKEKFEEKLGKKVLTSIEPFGKFTLAEEYHQKYFQKNRR